MIIYISWDFSILWNLRRIKDCRSFSVLETLTDSRAEKSSVTNHGFVFWAQREPNAILEIYKAFQDRLTFLNQHMIVWFSWILLDLWNLLKRQDCRSFSTLKTLTGYRPYSRGPGGDICLKQGQGMRGRAAPPYSGIYRVPPQFSENICSEDDLRSRIFGTFFVKFLACLPLLILSNI